MKNITVVQLNDLHGYMEQHQEWFWCADGIQYRRVGGLGRIKAVVDSYRARGESVLFCDNGDTLHGTYPLVQTECSIIVPALNQLGLAAMTAHWEFAYGPATLLERTKDLTYPLLATNVYWKDSGARVFPPYRIVDVDGLRVAILGIACNIVDKTMPASYSEGVRFTDGTEELPEFISHVREKENAEVVVLLSHLGFPQDCDVLERISGIDVCLSSYTHTRLSAPVMVKKTIVVQAGCHGSFLTRLRIGVDLSGVSLIEHELVTVDASLESDKEIDAMIREAMTPFRDFLDEPLGSITTNLNRATMLESTADNFLLQSILNSTESQLAFSNGWRYGAPIPAGLVTRNDLYNLVPMNPEIMRVELTGAELAEMIEENLERTYSRTPLQQMGGYTKRCFGMTAYFKVEDPKGHRLQSLFVGRDPVDRKATYPASFITVQGVPAKFGTNRQKTGIHAVEAMEKYLKKGRSCEIRGTFTLV